MLLPTFPWKLNDQKSVLPTRCEVCGPLLFLTGRLYWVVYDEVYSQEWTPKDMCYDGMDYVLKT